MAEPHDAAAAARAPAGGGDHAHHGHEHGHGHGHGHVHSHVHSHDDPPHAGPDPHHAAHAGHDRAHPHAGGHVHAPADFGRAFAIGITLNTAFVAVEAYWGWRVESLALLADAGHNLGDVAGLVMAWGGALAAKHRPGPRYTYGWKRATILAAFVNAVLLLVAMGSLAWEAVLRLRVPEPVPGLTVMAVAATGIVVNLATALLFARGQDDLNIRGAYLHMAADALVSAGVVVVGGLALWTGSTWLDPVASLVIALVIVAGSWNLFRRSLRLLFDAVPDEIDLTEVRRLLASQPGVERVHDLHVWATGTTEVALTAHLVTPAGPPGDAFLETATRQLRERFRIGHVTLQTVRAPFVTLCEPEPDTSARPARPRPAQAH